MWSEDHETINVIVEVSKSRTMLGWTRQGRNFRSVWPLFMRFFLDVSIKSSIFQWNVTSFSQLTSSRCITLPVALMDWLSYTLHSLSDHSHYLCHRDGWAVKEVYLTNMLAKIRINVCPLLIRPSSLFSGRRLSTTRNIELKQHESWWLQSAWTERGDTEICFSLSRWSWKCFTRRINICSCSFASLLLYHCEMHTNVHVQRLGWPFYRFLEGGKF